MFYMKIMSFIFISINILLHTNVFADGYQSPTFGIYIHDGYGEDIIERVAKTGASFTYVKIFWNDVETIQDTWNWGPADSRILPKISRGIHVGVKLVSSNHWGTEPISMSRKINRKKGRVQRDSVPPKDLDYEWSSTYGYSRDYYDFVYKVVRKYGDKVKYWAIENEITYQLNFTGGLEKYRLLLATAYKAVKDARRDALVLNHGPSSGSYGEAIAFELFDSGRQREALDFYNDYMFPHRLSKKVTDIAELRDIFKKNNASGKYEIIIEGLKNSRNYDVYQLHFYDKAEMLDRVLSWIKKKKKEFSNNRPIVCWEMGYYWKNNSTYNKEEHAADIFKKVIILLANDIGVINYHSIFGRSKKGDPWRGLYETYSGREKRPAGFVYENLIKLFEQNECRTIIAIRDGLYSCRSKDKELFFLWAETDKKYLPGNIRDVTPYDIYGNPHKRTENGNSREAPVYYIMNSL